MGSAEDLHKAKKKMSEVDLFLKENLFARWGGADNGRIKN